MKYLYMKSFFAFLVVFFCLSPVFGQQKIDLVSQLGIQDDIKKLEQLVNYRISQNELYRKVQEQEGLQQVHVYELTLKGLKKHICKKDFLNYSFLKRLKCNYVLDKDSSGKYRKYIKARTFLIKADGTRLGEYTTGHGRLYTDLSCVEFDNQLCLQEKTSFLFMNGVETHGKHHFRECSPKEYILLRNDTAYVLFEFESSVGSGYNMVPWVDYIEGIDFDGNNCAKSQKMDKGDLNQDPYNGYNPKTRTFENK